jgi:hypothetical protein
MHDIPLVPNAWYTNALRLLYHALVFLKLVAL